MSSVLCGVFTGEWLTRWLRCKQLLKFVNCILMLLSLVHRSMFCTSVLSPNVVTVHYEPNERVMVLRVLHFELFE